METWFWYAELDHKTNDLHETAHNSGIVHADCAKDAFQEACRDARGSLDAGSFTIKQFNKVS